MRDIQAVCASVVEFQRAGFRSTGIDSRTGSILAWLERYFQGKAESTRSRQRTCHETRAEVRRITSKRSDHATSISLVIPSTRRSSPAGEESWANSHLVFVLANTLPFKWRDDSVRCWILAEWTCEREQESREVYGSRASAYRKRREIGNRVLKKWVLGPRSSTASRLARTK